MKCRAAARGAHDHPAAVWAVFAEEGKEVLTEGVRGGICSLGRGELVGDFCLLGEGAVEDVEGGLVGLRVHVRYVGRCGPVNCFGAEFNRGEFGEEVRRCPGAVDGPLLDRLGQNKGLVGPIGGVVLRRQVR